MQLQSSLPHFPCNFGPIFQIRHKDEILGVLKFLNPEGSEEKQGIYFLGVKSAFTAVSNPDRKKQLHIPGLPGLFVADLTLVVTNPSWEEVAVC